MKKLLLSLTGATTAGALTLISPASWSPRVRCAYVVAPGVLVAAGSALALTRIADRRAAGDSGVESATKTTAEDAHPFPQHLPVAARVAVPLGLGAATCGIQASSLWIDAALERWLVRLGAHRPRRWMAVLAVVTSLGMDAVGERVTARTADDRAAS